jgi:hypothetical protein
MTASASMFLVGWARVRPASTRERAMGRFRTRSTMPLQRSWASPMDVVIPPISTASRSTAGMT